MQNKKLKMEENMPAEDLPYLGDGIAGPVNEAYEARIEKGFGQRTTHRTRLQRLKDAKRSLESKLDEVNTAIYLLEANPQMNEILEALEKAGV